MAIKAAIVAGIVVVILLLALAGLSYTYYQPMKPNPPIVPPEQSSDPNVK